MNKLFLKENIILVNNITTTSFIYTSNNFIRRLGIQLLILMPLISLTNYWEITKINNLSIRGIDLFFILISIVFIIHIILYGKIHHIVPLYFGLILIFFSISFFGLIVLPDYLVQWPALFRFIQTLLWGILALTFVKSNKDLMIISINVIIAGAIIASYSLYLYISIPRLNRIAGFFSAAGSEGFGKQSSFNEIGAVHVVALLLSLYYLFLYNKKLQRVNTVIIGICSILNMFGLIFVQSRSAFLAFTIGCFLFILPQVKNIIFYCKFSKKIIIYSTIVLIIGVIIILCLTYVTNISRLLNTVFPGTSEYNSAITRFFLWQRGTKVWLNKIPYFILGYGFRSTERFIGAESTHNFFLNISLWMGIVGLVTSIILLILPKIIVFSRYKKTINMDIVNIVFYTALVFSIFGNTLVDPFYGGCTFLLLYGAIAPSNILQDRKI